MTNFLTLNFVFAFDFHASIFDLFLPAIIINVKKIMATTEEVKAYINQLCMEIGTTADKVYNPQTSAWYFTRGSSKIEVFLTAYQTPKGMRTFIRCFAPLYNIPTGDKRLDFYQGALEVNTQYMGVKLGTLADKNLLCAISERDIEGMDYPEMVTLISDIGYWADELDDFLKKTFG
ncbi:MAG: YbjN domain-containing protein [Chitinophagaceae bacterium]